MLSDRQTRDLLGLAFFALALFTGLSLLPPSLVSGLGGGASASGNLMGLAGAHLSDVAYVVLGAGAPLLPLFPLLAGVGLFGWAEWGRAVRLAVLLAGTLILVPTAFGVLAAGAPHRLPGGGTVFPAGLAGLLGQALGAPLVRGLGLFGGAILIIFLAFALPLVTVGWNPARALGRGVGRGLGAVRGKVRGAVARRKARPAPAEALAGVDADLDHAAGAGEGGGSGLASNGLADLSETAEVEGPLPWDEAAGELAPVTGALTGSGTDGSESGGEAAGGGAGTKTRRFGGLPRLRGRKKEGARPVETELEDFGDPTSTDLPSIELLSAPPERDEALSAQELDRLGQVLIDTLGTFKVEGRIDGRTTGPVVTQFEVVPAPGIKVSRIANLDADLALALKAPSVRIVAPIPGKGAVGVEVPNPTPEVVYLREILGASPFRRSRGPLPLALGRDLAGKPYVSDLARMPHLLIAGATGSGKSVCINTIITSLVYRHSPQTLRLLMIDPKMVELSMYGDLPHLRHPVVTDPSDAAVVLKWAVLEMERRYALLSVNGARSLDEFNRRVESGQPVRLPEAEGEEGDPDRWLYQDGPLPYIVVIVDELADLMMAVQAEVERPLAQLAQKARAIGIHLIVATQRPSVNVITGLIKANFPCRIAFRVSSKVDSRTIIDQNGADALLGNGDMLFLPPGTSDPVRIQGAFLATEDTERLMAWYREQGAAEAWEAPGEESDILEVVRAHEAESAEEGLDAVDEERDALFRQAAEVCVQFQQGSTSLLQRRLRIGYGRAARIIDQLHNAGVLGPPDGSKPREVLVGPESLENICGE